MTLQLLFWFWLGGAVSHGVFWFSSTLHKHHWRFVKFNVVQAKKFYIWISMGLSVLVACALWPLGVIALVVDVHKIQRRFDKRSPEYAMVKCEVCGFEEEIAVWGDNKEWVRLPQGWWHTSNHEIACSRVCADNISANDPDIARREVVH